MSPINAAAFRVPESGMGRAESEKEANLPCSGSALVLQGGKAAEMDVLPVGPGMSWAFSQGKPFPWKYMGEKQCF